MAAVLTAVTGRAIAYLDEPEDAGRAPRDAAERTLGAALREFGGEMRAGRLAMVTGDVERLTGRPAISFEQFLADHGWAFVAAAPGGQA